MPLKSLLYLAQLEEYDLKRIKKWLKDNPGHVVEENKGHLVWTTKIKILHLLSRFFSIFLSPISALILALNITSPFDKIFKEILVFLAKVKLFFLHRKMMVIGITGSWGKTTAKEKIAAILKSKYKVAKTEGNNNTLLGVAKTIFRISQSCEIFVCEMAAYQRGDIAKIAQLTKPRVGVITAVGSMHLERFGTLENILRTKMELHEAIPMDGLTVLPKELKVKIKRDKNIFFFSNEEEIYYKIGEYFKIPKVEARKVLENFSPPPHRQQVIHSGALTIIDDTYNSNPVGFKMALQKLDEIKGKRKILVTPGMIELGDVQFEENQKIGSWASKICDYIIIVGEANRRALLSGAESGGSAKTLVVKDLEEAKEKMAKIALPNSVVLLENDLPDHYF